MSKKKVHQDSVQPEVDKVKWLSTMGGTIIGHLPEYKTYGEDKWRVVPTETRDSNIGVPYPLIFGGVTQEAHLFGHAQAQALAWTYKAFCEANGDLFTETRVVDYEIVFDIKARRINESGA